MVTGSLNSYVLGQTEKNKILGEKEQNLIKM